MKEEQIWLCEGRTRARKVRKTKNFGDIDNIIELSKIVTRLKVGKKEGT